MSKKQHLSRLSAPKSWPVKRKGIKWIAKPKPGVYSLEFSLPISVVLRDLLHISNTTRETRFMLNSKEILVNNRVITEVNFAVGLFDVISIPKLKKHYRILMSRNNKFVVVEIPEKESTTLLLRIDNKTKIKKGKIQLNLMNGWNLIADKKSYKTKDVLVFDSKTNKIKDVLVAKKGVIVYFFKGKHSGKIAKLDAIRETGILRKNKIARAINDKGEVWETSINNMIVVGKTSPLIKLS